jgi:ABC-type nitrate/sulfonate/bicarbonate transport system substrate-binding protein
MPTKAASSGRGANRCRPRTSLLIAVGAATALLTAACGSPGAAGDGGDGPSGGTDELKVTTLSLCNEISVLWAKNKGVFEKNGLKVELVKAAGGAAGLAAVQGGSANLAFTNPFSTMLALNSGIDLKWVATAYGTPKKGDRPSNAILVQEDSDIRKGTDLHGKTVAVNELGGINQIIVQQFVTDAGGDPKKVKFVALPFGELAPSVASGKVDASQAPEQYSNTPGVRSIGDPYMEVGKDKSLIFAGYVGTSRFVDENTEAMKKFQTSLKEANTAVNDPANKDEKFKMEAAHCGQDAKKLAEDPENPYFADVPMDAMKQMAQILVDQSQTDKLPDVEKLVPEYARR